MTNIYNYLSETEFESLTTKMPMSIYRLDIKNDFTLDFITQNIEKMTGYPLSLFFQMPPFWPQQVHPEDIIKFSQKNLLEHQHNIREYRFRHANGQYIWIQDEYFITYDEQKNPLKLLGFLLNITKYKKNEIALQNSDVRYRSLIDATPHGIQENDLDGIITFTNDAHSKILEYPENYMLGKPIWHTVASDEDKEALKKYLKLHILYQSAPKPYLCKNITRTGKIILLQIDWNYIRDNKGKLQGFISCITDITETKTSQEKLERQMEERTHALKQANLELHNEIVERKRTQEALRKSERRYRTLASSAPTGIYHCDTKGNFLYVNERFCEITMLRFADTLGKGWMRSIHIDDKKEFFKLWKNNLIPDQFKFTFRIHRDSKLKWIQTQAAAEKNHLGEIVGYVGTITDITQTLEAEEQIRKHKNEIEHFSRLSTVGIIASGLAHELNQPLAAIVNYIGGCITRLNKEKVSPDIIEAMKRVMLQAEHAGSIINRVKDFLKKGQLHLSRISVWDIIQQTLKLVEHDLQTNKINIEVFPPTENYYINVDIIQIEQVFINIVRNAIEALQFVHENQRKIKIELKLLDSKILAIIISDTGPGIEKDKLRNLFRVFYTTKPTGMGMGLPISRAIVESHGGQILVDSTVGEGSTFTIHLHRLENHYEEKSDHCDY